MGNNAVCCPWIRSLSGCVLNVVSEEVRKLHTCHEGEEYIFRGWVLLLISVVVF